MMAHAAPRNRNRGWRLSRRGQIFLLFVLYTLGALQAVIITMGFARMIWAIWTALGVN